MFSRRVDIYFDVNGVMGVVSSVLTYEFKALAKAASSTIATQQTYFFHTITQQPRASEPKRQSYHRPLQTQWPLQPTKQRCRPIRIPPTQLAPPSRNQCRRLHHHAVELHRIRYPTAATDCSFSEREDLPRNQIQRPRQLDTYHVWVEEINAQHRFKMIVIFLNTLR
jgi:hypothetical protein